MKKEQESKVVSLPVELYDRIEARAKATDFGSVDEYVLFVLEEILKQEEKEGEAAASREDEEEVKKRLKSLGYLD